MRRRVYSEGALALAFADPANVPGALRSAMVTDWPLIARRYVDILVAGDGSPEPRVRPLLVWGALDRLAGSRARDGERWRARLAGSTLCMIEGAGHFPQLEAPETFVDAVDAFVPREPWAVRCPS